MGDLCERIRVLDISLTIDRHVVALRGRLEVPPHISSPACPTVPRGIMREPLKFKRPQESNTFCKEALITKTP